MAAMLFLHGAPGDARVWAPVLAALGPVVDAHAVTLTYFGQGEWPDDGSAFGTQVHAADIIVAAEELAGEGPVRLVAWSYSCHPALLAAIRRPDLFEALFLYEPGLPTYVTSEQEHAAFAADAGSAFGPIVTALREGGDAAAVEALFASSGGEGCFAGLNDERQHIYLDNARIMPLLLGCGQPPANIGSDDVRGIELPAVVGLGEYSRAVFSVPARALAELLPNGGLALVPGADHMLPETGPEKFAAIIGEWLAKG